MTTDLFLVPFDDPNVRRTVEDPVFQGADLPDSVPDGVRTTPRPRIWGVRDGSRNEPTDDRMDSEDHLLFSNDGAYWFAGRVDVTFESPDIARTYWGHAPATRCYSVEDVVPIRLLRVRLNENRGYVDDWYPQGVTRVSDERRRTLRNHYGSVGALVNDVTNT